MKATILLTAWNRPQLLRRAIESVKAQTHQDFECLILDDGSDQETLDLYREINDGRFQVHLYHPTSHDRAHSTRYSANINRWLPGLTDGIVCYMTDNTEYKPTLLEKVTKWFEDHPLGFSAYVVSDRDVYSSDGEYLGEPRMFGHWASMPDKLIPWGGDITGHLDHSQVFHRLPVELLWDEGIGAKPCGDALFYNRLIQAHGPIYPAVPYPLLTEHIVK